MDTNCLNGEGSFKGTSQAGQEGPRLREINFLFNQYATTAEDLRESLSGCLEQDIFVFD